MKASAPRVARDAVLLEPTSGSPTRPNCLTIERPADEPATSLVPVVDLPFALEVPDAALPPTLVASTAYRLRAVDLGRIEGLASLREPFLELVDAVHVGPSRFCVTSRMAVRGTREAPTFEADLILTALGGDEVGAEIAAVDRHLAERFFGPARVFAADRVAMKSLDLPTTGDGVFIRQASIAVGEEACPSVGSDRAGLPVRFAFPGPAALTRLLGALTTAGPGTDLFVTVSPTSLREAERESLERARGAASASDDVARLRDAATAIDAVLSFRTEVSVIQVLLVGQQPVAEVARRLVANALTAGFDTQLHLGHRVVASPQHFVGGGHSIEPCRNVTEVLSRLRFGLPLIGYPDRDPSDLVTATEVGYCLGWAADESGAIPGIAESTSEAPPFDPESGWTIGRDPLGRAAGLADADRCLHTVFIGSSGSGKTTLFERAIRHDLNGGHTVIVIDPHGDLLRRALAHVPRRARRHVYHLDGSEGAGDRLNLLHLSSSATVRRLQAAALVEGSVTDMNKDFAGPVFHQVVVPLLGVLGDSGRTLADLHTYLSDPSGLTDDAEASGREDAIALACEMRGWSLDHRAEMATWARSKFHWAGGDAIRATVCAAEPTFQLADALAPGSVLLVDPGDDLSAGAVFASVLLSVLLTSFSDRSLSSPPVSIYLDEVQRFSGNMVRRAMNEARKRAVALHLATQNLTNVSNEFEAILGNAGHLLLGRCVGPTAAFAEHELGLRASTMGRLPNLRAMCRLSPGGQPCVPFALDIDPPTEAMPTEWPRWLGAAVEKRVLSAAR